MEDEQTQHWCIGPYRVLRRLGAGGLGEVWLAEDERLGRRVAIKRLHGDGADPETRERLRREARAAARLTHPAVARIYDLLEGGADSNGDALVMEYVEGPTVAELLEEGPLALGRACRIARQAAEGLAAAHEHGLVHRDLKAENVLVARMESGDRAKILDFGLAKRVAAEDVEAATVDGGADGGVVGTYRAMAPEQARGQEVDHRTDLFALGVLLYEMVTGRSPFRAATPYETLRRVVEEEPEPAAHLRAGLPPALGTLIESLLGKDPDRRPQDAATVAGALGRIASQPGIADGPSASRHPPAGERPDDPGTVPPDGDPTAGTLPPGKLREVSRSAPDRTGRRARPAALAVAAVVLMLAGAAAWWWTGSTAPPVRVAVLPPELGSAAGPSGSEGDDLARAAANLRVSALRALVELEGVSAVDPETLGAVEGTPLELGRAAAAEEVITGSIAPAGRELARVELARIGTAEGRVLWSEAFDIPTGPQDALVAASAIAAALRRAYRDTGGVADPAEPAVRPEDYAAFLDVQRHLDTGVAVADWQPALDDIEEVLQGSPRFVDAHLLAADLADSLYSDTRTSEHLERARHHLARVRSLAPHDPRRFSLEIEVALARGDTVAAEEVLNEMERLRPGDPAVLVGQSRLAEAEGDLDRAIALRERVVERRGTWQDLYRLADLEARHGKTAAARDHMEQLLLLVPGYPQAQAKLAEIELLYGDPARAEKLYMELVTKDPHRSNFTNLGLARLLLGRYGEAVESLRRALSMAPDHVTTILNLADAEQARGDDEAARALYAKALGALGSTARERPLDPGEQLMRAQCLARLGNREEAVELALATLQRAPEDAEVAYQAALVFVLAGEDASALASAKRALGLGMAPRWFTLPGFEPLRGRAGLLAPEAPPLPS